MDLVDEEHGARLERGQERGDVALALERRPGRLDERDVELVRHDLRERGLAEPGRAGEQHVVERLAAAPRRLDEDRELVLDRALPDEVVERARAQRAVELLLRAGRRGGLQPLDPGRADALRHRAAFSAPAISSSGDSPSAASSSASASCALKPEALEPLAREHARVVGLA